MTCVTCDHLLSLLQFSQSISSWDDLSQISLYPTVLTDNNTESKGLMLPNSDHRRKLHWSALTVLDTLQTVFALVTSKEKISLDYIRISMDVVTGGKLTVNASYSLTIEGGTPITGTFSYSPTSNKTASGRRLLQSGGNKEMIIDYLLKAAINYIGTKFPTIKPFLPKDKQSTATGKN